MKRARLNFLDSNIQKQDAGLPDDYEICKKGETLRNHALKGGRKAGAYYKIGKVKTFDECIDLCCGSDDCTLALFVKRSCYSVECESAQLCKPIRVHRAIKPSIFRRYRGRFWRNILVRMCDRIEAILLCNVSISDWVVSIRISDVSISLFTFNISVYFPVQNDYLPLFAVEKGIFCYRLDISDTFTILAYIFQVDREYI